MPIWVKYGAPQLQADLAQGVGNFRQAETIDQIQFRNQQAQNDLARQQALLQLQQQAQAFQQNQSTQNFGEQQREFDAQNALRQAEFGQQQYQFNAGQNQHFNDQAFTADQRQQQNTFQQQLEQMKLDAETARQQTGYQDQLGLAGFNSANDLQNKTALASLKDQQDTEDIARIDALVQKGLADGTLDPQSAMRIQLNARNKNPANFNTLGQLQGANDIKVNGQLDVLGAKNDEAEKARTETQGFKLMIEQTREANQQSMAADRSQNSAGSRQFTAQAGLLDAQARQLHAQLSSISDRIGRPTSVSDYTNAIAEKGTVEQQLQAVLDQAVNLNRSRAGQFSGAPTGTDSGMSGDASDYYQQGSQAAPSGDMSAFNSIMPQQSRVQPSTQPATTGRIYINPQTGQKIQWDGTQWISAQ